MTEDGLPTADHDLLVELRTNVSNMRDDIRALNLAVKDRTDDHEQRIRNIEASYVSWPRVAVMITALAALVGALWWIKP